MGQYIMALDQGTTSSRAAVFDREGRLAGLAGRELGQTYPRPGWVEHDPEEIWRITVEAAREALREAGLAAEAIRAIGITNQRETTVVWDRHTGKPVCPAVVWQCRRTAPLCEDLRARGLEELFRRKTGLVLDAYFSGTKIRWILDNIPGAREKAAQGGLAFGTVDSWIIYKLTGGRVHVTDCSNASRTLLFNIHDLRWDEEILDILSIPSSLLPEVRSSSEVYGTTEREILGAPIPIAGAAGDQQAATFGQGCFAAGIAKNTYGTGCFMLMHTGSQAVESRHGLLATVAWSLDGRVEYALEGSIFVAGAAVQWLRDDLKILDSSAGSGHCAAQVEDTGGVYVVPAFTGLGAPYWDMYARGAVLGLTRGTTRNHLIRATLEAIAYQVRDVVEAMEKDAGLKLQGLRVDGGAAANNFLMQFQADILGVRVERPVVTETTALGAACLAGLAVGFWSSREEIVRLRQREKLFSPGMDHARREQLYRGWQKAVDRSRNWADE